MLGPNGAGKTTLVLHLNGMLRRRLGGVGSPGWRSARSTCARSAAGSASSSRTPTTSCSCRRSATTSPSARPTSAYRRRARRAGRRGARAVGHGRVRRPAAAPPVASASGGGWRSRRCSRWSRRSWCSTSPRATSTRPAAASSPRSCVELDVTTLMVTHDLPYALELCPRAVILSEGVDRGRRSDPRDPVRRCAHAGAPPRAALRVRSLGGRAGPLSTRTEHAHRTDEGTPVTAIDPTPQAPPAPVAEAAAGGERRTPPRTSPRRPRRRRGRTPRSRPTSRPSAPGCRRRSTRSPSGCAPRRSPSGAWTRRGARSSTPTARCGSTASRSSWGSSRCSSPTGCAGASPATASRTGDNRAMSRRLPRGVEPVLPGPGQESVWDYPRPPRVEPSPSGSSSSRRVRDRRHDPCVPRAGDQPPAVLVPPARRLRRRRAAARPRRSWCEYKGEAAYFDVVGGDRRARAPPGRTSGRRAASRRSSARSRSTRAGWTAARSTARWCGPRRAASTAAGSPPTWSARSRAGRAPRAGEGAAGRFPAVSERRCRSSC